MIFLKRQASRMLGILLLSCSALCLSGCLTHWFVEAESRLQVENATKDCSIVAVEVVSLDGSTSKSWIDETLLPGERSRVEEGDWVGEFHLRIKYTNSTDASGEVLEDLQTFELDGGSLYLVIRGNAESLEYKFK